MQLKCAEVNYALTTSHCISVVERLLIIQGIVFPKIVIFFTIVDGRKTDSIRKSAIIPAYTLHENFYWYQDSLIPYWINPIPNFHTIIDDYYDDLL